MSLRKLICVLFVIGCLPVLVAQDYLAYPVSFKKGTVEYKLSKKGLNYYGKVFISAGGEKQAFVIEEAEARGVINDRIIIEDGFKFDFDIQKKLITKIPYKNFQNLICNYASMKFVGDSVLLGRNVKKYSDSGKTAYFWNEYLIKYSDSINMVFYEVTQVESNSNLPTNIYEIPKDYRIKEINYNFDY